jgi:hypothetical protein
MNDGCIHGINYHHIACNKFQYSELNKRISVLLPNIIHLKSEYTMDNFYFFLIISL